MKQFATRQQLSKVLRRMVSPALRDSQGDLIGEADLMVEVIAQAVDDRHFDWINDSNSFFPEICELLGLDVAQTRHMILDTSKAYFFRNNKGFML